MNLESKGYIWIPIKFHLEGRMVTAHLDSDRRGLNSKEDRWEYIGLYTYTAPDGKQYKMKARGIFFLLSWVIGIVIYFNLIGHFIMPFVMR